MIGMVLAVLPSNAQDTMAKPSGAIVDKASLLKPEQTKAIQQIITNLQNLRQTNAYLLIMDSMPGGQNLFSFTKGIFKKWELNTGNEGKNLIMVYSIKDHGVRFEASDAIIKIVTKEYLKEVIDTSVKPYLKKRMDFEGLRRGLEMVTKMIENN